MYKPDEDKNIDPLIIPVRTIDKMEKQLIGAGYKVEKKIEIDHSAQYIEVFNPDDDISDGYLRKVVFLYDHTGHILEKMTVTMTPYELNHDKEEKVF